MAKALCLMPWIAAVLLGALSYYFLVVLNSDTLFMIQTRSIFVDSDAFWSECVAVPGGLLQWAGSWLTQLFYHPGQGAAAMIAIWLLTFATCKRAFRISNAWSSVLIIPFVCIMLGIISIGYWIYYNKLMGYYFIYTLGALFISVVALIGSFDEKLKDNGTKQLIFAALLAVATSASYIAVGHFALVALAVLAVKSALKKQFIPAGIHAACAAITPLICKGFYSQINVFKAYTANFPFFEAAEASNPTLSVPYYIVIACFVAYCFMPMIQKAVKSTIVPLCVSLAVVLLSGYTLHTLNYDNYNFHAECRMYDDVEEARWDDIIREAAKAPGDVTREMVIFKNIALANTGKIGTQMFHYNNMGEPPYVFDSLAVRMVHTAGPLIYMHHGKTNFAYRWAMENSVEYGFTINNLKVLALSSIFNEEYNLARKYLSVLQHTLYYKDWADRYMKVVEKPELAREYDELKNIIELRDHMGSTLDGDEGLCEMYLINYFSNTMNKDSKYLQELTLMYALIQKDIQLFWPRFFLYATLHKGEDMPVHYQEAALLYGRLEPQSMDVSNMPFDKEKILDRYASFNQMSQSLLASGMTPEQVGESMKGTFGDTFWWFYFFCRDVHSY